MRAFMVVLILAFAGCASPAEVNVPAGDLLWPTLEVTTNATEPHEFRGFMRAAWDGQVFALDVQREPGLKARTVVAGDRLYESQTGMGWVHEELPPRLASGRSDRLLLWDLPRLLAMPGLDVEREQDGQQATIRAAGTVTLGRSFTVDLVVTTDGERVTGARLHAVGARETPFLFAPTTEPLRFPVAVPAESLSRQAVFSGDAEARDGHDVLMGLIDDHAGRRAGVLPERVDAASLAAEMTLSGQDWPINYYDGQDLSDQEESGHFSWTRCSLRAGIYVGFGWDGPIVSRSWGDEPCSPAASWQDGASGAAVGAQQHS